MRNLQQELVMCPARGYLASRIASRMGRLILLPLLLLMLWAGATAQDEEQAPPDEAAPPDQIEMEVPVMEMPPGPESPEMPPMNEHELDPEEAENMPPGMEPGMGPGMGMIPGMEPGDEGDESFRGRRREPSGPTSVRGASAGPVFRAVGRQSAAASETPTLEPGEGLRLNFRGVPLNDVLNYLSEAGGFSVLVEEGISLDRPVEVWSHQPLSREEAVELLDSVLNEAGYAAVRSGRTLKIVQRDAARTMNLPVRMGANPESIPVSDQMVTQIIPVRYTDARQLVENLQALMPEHAVLSANQSSNALVITDTQTNVRRMVEIVSALDTSISSISTVRVFPLQYADAEEIVTVITGIFEAPQSSQNEDPRSRMMRMFRGMRGGGPPQEDSGSDSEARQAASRVVAVAETRTNSVIVSAPDEAMPVIEALVDEVDRATEDITAVRVFALQHADATEMASLIEEVFATESTSQSSGPGRFFSFMRGGPSGGSGSTAQTERGKLESRVVAKPDTRTNSVVVTASSEMMPQIEGMIQNLDNDPSRKQKVFVYPINNANPEEVANVLRGLFETDTVTEGRDTSNRNDSTQRNTTSTSDRTSGSGSSSSRTGDMSRTR